MRLQIRVRETLDPHKKAMEMEVVGRHALLFDDDAMAAFVNSTDALVEWNSIPIDRYDVRHLLSSPPPPRRRNYHHPIESIESELDLERYADLSYQQQGQLIYMPCHQSNSIRSLCVLCMCLEQ